MERRPSVLANHFSQQVQRDALRFAEADIDGNNVLDWDEFLSMQPARVRETHSVEEIRSWFEAADLGGNNGVTINDVSRSHLSLAPTLPRSSTQAGPQAPSINHSCHTHACCVARAGP